VAQVRKRTECAKGHPFVHRVVSLLTLSLHDNHMRSADGI
jgi:hypothetical protein